LKKIYLGFDEFDVFEKPTINEEDEMSTDFSYVVLRETGQQKSAWRVVKWIIHPNYFLDWRDLLLSFNESARYHDITDLDSNLAQILSAIAKIDYDIALLKVEQDDSIFTSSMEAQENEDVLDEVIDDIGDVWYDSLPSNDTLEEPHNSACVEHMQQGRVLTEEIGNTRRRAFCVKVGYSPVSVRYSK